MSNLTKTDTNFLLSLARENLEQYLKTNKKITIAETDLPSDILKKERATFVTLTKNNELRGCIGHLTPIDKLYVDVINNSISAAIEDPRFPPVTLEELTEIKIEISILTIPEKLNFTDADDLLKKLIPNKMGVIIKKDYYQATFLPQVWEQLADKEEFLSHLCAKAGLDPSAWKNEDIEVETYRVEKFAED